MVRTYLPKTKSYLTCEYLNEAQKGELGPFFYYCMNIRDRYNEIKIEKCLSCKESTLHFKDPGFFPINLHVNRHYIRSTDGGRTWDWELEEN